jgi:hypothetical protein
VDPITKVVGGKAIIVASVPSATAFNVVFGIAIAFSVSLHRLELSNQQQWIQKWKWQKTKKSIDEI